MAIQPVEMLPARQYVGARYVPKLADPIEWNDQMVYEPLTIVTYLNSSYTSRKLVPAGTLPTNNEYWALTGNFNGQVEMYRQEVEELSDDVSNLTEQITDFETTINNDFDTFKTEVNNQILKIGVIPDNFPGATDSEKVQAAVNSITSSGGTVTLNRKYNITTPIDISGRSGAGAPKIYINSIGGGFTLNSCALFTSSTQNSGGLCMIGVNVNGVGEGTYISNSGNKIIRTVFIGCTFYNLSGLLGSATYENNDYGQDHRFIGCHITGVTKPFNYYTIYQLSLNNCIMENCGPSATFFYGYSLLVRNCIIEGCTGPVFTVGNILPYIIDGCYFELNTDCSMRLLGGFPRISNNTDQCAADSCTFKLAAIPNNGEMWGNVTYVHQTSNLGNLVQCEDGVVKKAYHFFSYYDNRALQPDFYYKDGTGFLVVQGNITIPADAHENEWQTYAINVSDLPGAGAQGYLQFLEVKFSDATVILTRSSNNVNIIRATTNATSPFTANVLAYYTDSAIQA